VEREELGAPLAVRRRKEASTSQMTGGVE